jgi:hypothetical protein
LTERKQEVTRASPQRRSGNAAPVRHPYVRRLIRKPPVERLWNVMKKGLLAGDTLR